MKINKELKMTVKEASFFYLYNDPYYYDKMFGCKTYHNEVMSYMIVYLKDKKAYEKYGSIEKSYHRIAEDGNIMLDFSKGEFILNNFQEVQNNSFGDFYFKDHISYLEVMSKARDLMLQPNIVEAQREYRKRFKGGDEALKEQTFMRLYDLVQDKKTENKYVVEGSKLLGNWLGIEQNTAEVSINAVLNGIEAGLKAIEEE